VNRTTRESRCNHPGGKRGIGLARPNGCREGAYVFITRTTPGAVGQSGSQISGKNVTAIQSDVSENLADSTGFSRPSRRARAGSTFCLRMRVIVEPTADLAVTPRTL